MNLAAVDYFWARVDKDGPLSERRPDLGECWLWQGAQLRGYGRFTFCRRGYYAHRFAYMAEVGSIPAGFQIDHLCFNPTCVRPSHLEAVTPQENNRRSNSLSARRGRQTHCKRGHEFTEANTYATKRGQRYCRPCHNAAMAERRARSGQHQPIKPEETR